jgi:hypothetical protein
VSSLSVAKNSLSSSTKNRYCSLCNQGPLSCPEDHFVEKHREYIDDSKLAGLVGQSGFGNVFSGLISFGGLTGEMFGGLAGDDINLDDALPNQTSLVPPSPATKKSSKRSSSHSDKNSNSPPMKRKRCDDAPLEKEISRMNCDVEKEVTKNKNKNSGGESNGDDDEVVVVVDDDDDDGGGGGGGGNDRSKTAFAFFQTNLKSMVVKKAVQTASTSVTVREPKNSLEFFAANSMKVMGEKLDIRRARGAWNSLSDELRNLFTQQASLDTKRCSVELETNARAQRVEKGETLEKIKDPIQRLHMEYLGRFVRRDVMRTRKSLYGRIIEILDAKSLLTVKYEDGTGEDVKLSKIDEILLQENWPYSVFESSNQCACTFCGKPFDCKDAKDECEKHENENCLVFRIECDVSSINKKAKDPSTPDTASHNTTTSYVASPLAPIGSRTSGHTETKATNSAMSAIYDELECPVCLEIFDTPTILPNCGHSFCEHCLNELPSKQCPSCRKPFDQDQVRLNYALAGVCSMMRDREQKNEEEEEEQTKNN